MKPKAPKPRGCPQRWPPDAHNAAAAQPDLLQHRIPDRTGVPFISMISMPQPDQYRVLGHPVEHSKSPQIHTRFAELTGQNMVYDRQCVPLDGFVQAVDFLRATGVRGCNVTVPFKFEAFRYAQQHGRVSERAALAQACNTLSFEGGSVFADNTDGIGLVNDCLLYTSPSPRDRQKSRMPSSA